jgi:hypothetical protein
MAAKTRFRDLLHVALNSGIGHLKESRCNLYLKKSGPQIALTNKLNLIFKQQEFAISVILVGKTRKE